MRGERTRARHGRDNTESSKKEDVTKAETEPLHQCSPHAGCYTSALPQAMARGQIS